MKRTLPAVLCLILVLNVTGVVKALADEAAGDAFMQKKEYRKAVTEYQKAIKEKGDSEALLVKLAEAYDGAAWYGMSVQIWESYLEKYPGGKSADRAKKQAARGRRWMAINFYNLGEDIEKVIHQLKRAVELDPALAEAYYWLGRVYLEEGKFEDAVATLEKLIALDKGNKKAQWLLKEARGMLEVGGEAYVAYREGYNLYDQGRMDEALEKYAKAAELNPEFAEAHLWMARIYFETEKYDLSIPEWEKVLELQPDNGRAEWFLRLSRSREKEQKKSGG